MARQTADVKALRARIRELEEENEILNDKIDAALDLFADDDGVDEDDDCDQEDGLDSSDSEGDDNLD